MKVEIRKPYDGKRNKCSIEFLDENGEQAIGRVEQHHIDDCDINLIIRKYDKTGLINHVNEAKADYGDFTEINEFQESLNLVNKANENFMNMPSAIRSKFENDAGKYMEFVTNPENEKELVIMGLAKEKEGAKDIIKEIIKET